MLSHFSRVRLYETLWTVACQAPLPMELSRQEYWSGLPCPSPGDHPHPGIEPGSLALQVNSLLSELPEKQCAYIKTFMTGMFRNNSSPTSQGGQPNFPL